MTDRNLLAALAGLLRRLDPVPPQLIADCVAAGLRITTNREPRLATPTLDQAWLLPLQPTQ